MFKNIYTNDSIEFNKLASHPLQSFEWGEFREELDTKVIRGIEVINNKNVNSFQLTLHPIPKTKYNIGYFPKGNLPNNEIINKLIEVGRQNNCVFIQLEPNVIKKPENNFSYKKLSLVNAAHPLFTKYNFVLDLNPSVDDLQKNMHSKSRYNIRVAEKHNVEIKQDNSTKGFDKFLELTHQTTKRQGFYAHSDKYFRTLWDKFSCDGNHDNKNKLCAHLFTAKYNNKTLVSWIIFVFKDTIYYPYGASSTEHRNVMASNLLIWEVIKFGKELGLKKFDMWGSLGPDPDKNSPWYGFHRFKSGYNPELVEYIGSYDLVINKSFYSIYKVLDKVRWSYLKLSKKL